MRMVSPDYKIGDSATSIPDGFRSRDAPDPDRKIHAALHPDAAHLDRCQTRRKNTRMPVPPTENIKLATRTGWFMT